jgi:hypothetical protein
MKPTPETITQITSHYRKQEEAIAKITNILKRKKFETEEEFVAYNLALSKPYPLALTHSVWAQNR